MSDLRKAAEMALEALNMQTPLDQREFELRNAAIEALRQALAKPEQEPVDWMDDYNACKCPDNESRCFSDRVFRMMQKYTAPTTQPEQEPVAWVSPNGIVVDKQGLKFYSSTVGTKFVGKQLYTAPPSIEAAVLAEREACAVMVERGCGDFVLGKKIAAAIRARGEK